MTVFAFSIKQLRKACTRNTRLPDGFSAAFLDPQLPSIMALPRIKDRKSSIKTGTWGGGALAEAMNPEPETLTPQPTIYDQSLLFLVGPL